MGERDEPRAIRHEYEALGVGGFYRARGNRYRNPHEPQVVRSLEAAVREWRPDLNRVLDLAAGSGEATLALRELGAGAIDAIDPFTFEAYRERTGQTAGRETFEQIAAGALAGRDYTLIVCSFAMHLMEPSRLPRLAIQLSLIGDRLLILTPHKRPDLRAEWGWALKGERVLQRVRSRIYRSTSRGTAVE
jgi:hypothetical protein